MAYNPLACGSVCGSLFCLALTFQFYSQPPQAAQQPDATGALPLHIAATMGASGEVKDMLVSAWPEPVEKATLAEALRGNWGSEAVRRIVASAPEVRCEYY